MGFSPVLELDFWYAFFQVYPLAAVVVAVLFMLGLLNRRRPLLHNLLLAVASLVAGAFAGGFMVFILLAGVGH